MFKDNTAVTGWLTAEEAKAAVQSEIDVIVKRLEDKIEDFKTLKKLTEYQNQLSTLTEQINKLNADFEKIL